MAQALDHTLGDMGPSTISGNPNGLEKLLKKVKELMQSLKSLSEYVKDFFTLPLGIPPADTEDWDTREKRVLQKTIAYSTNAIEKPWLARGEMITDESLDAMRKSLANVKFKSYSQI